MLRASVRLSVCLFPNSSETTERINFKFASMIDWWCIWECIEKILVTLCSKSRSPEVKRSTKVPFTVGIVLIASDHISDMQLCIFVDSSNCYPFTFLVKKPLIFAAQKLIAYHWKGNRTTNALSTINDHYSDNLNTKNGKNWILEKI